MHNCSISKKLQIVRGDINDYRGLGHYHYRNSKLGPFAAIFAIRPRESFAVRCGMKTVGVIVYTMPSVSLELRDVAMGNVFAGLDRTTRLALINKNIRCIGRVIIEPRFRGLGLASKLVRETMGKMNVAVIETMAVMGAVNPFFEKAGLQALEGPMPERCVQLTEAFSMVGIERGELVEPQKVQEKLERLRGDKAKFIEMQIREFLQSYGKRRNMEAGSERIRYVLSKLTARPIYYIWFNPKIAFSV